MAEFTAKCPHCSTELVAQEDWIGMEVECTSCNKSFTLAKEAPEVPNLSLQKIKPIPPAADTNEGNAETSFTFVCPECGTQTELPTALKGKKYECKACCEESIAGPATEKKCPHCGQTIKFHATICRFCKKNVNVSANASVNLQPIAPMQNQADVSLQPITPMQNQAGVSLQPITPMQNQAGVSLQPITPMQNAPYNSAPLTLTPVNRNTSVPGSWRITRQEIADIEKFYRFYWIGLLAGFIPFVGVFAAIAGMVFWFVLLYRFWKLVPVSEAETTPGKAVGFMFIPFFNFYWIFVSIWGLSKHFNRLAPEKNVETLGMIIAISTVCCAIPFVNFAALIVGFVASLIWAYRMKGIAVSSIPVTD